jgi:Family of unknown function (DUF6152)
MMQRFLRAAAFSLMALSTITAAALAHHGWSEYDEKKPLTVPGTITESSYTNPHGTIKLRATDGGKVWDVVLAPVSRMQARGLSEAMLKPGTVVTVLGYQHRKVATEMRAENITVDKKKIELR